MIVEFFITRRWLNNLIFIFLINATKNLIIVKTFNKYLKRNNRFVVVINKINNETYVSKIIDCINQFKLSLNNKIVVFEKNIDFTHESLIKTFDTVVYLWIVDNNKFKSNVSFSDVFHKIFVKIFDFIVNTNSSTFIHVMFNTIKKRLEWRQNFEFFFV